MKGDHASLIAACRPVMLPQIRTLVGRVLNALSENRPAARLATLMIKSAQRDTAKMPATAAPAEISLLVGLEDL
jgi:hypothetical protein